MAQLAESPTPVSSFRWNKVQEQKIPMLVWIKLESKDKKYSLIAFFIFSDTFYLLANQSLDPNLQDIASDYIVHYDYDQVLLRFDLVYLAI